MMVRIGLTEPFKQCQKVISFITKLVVVLHRVNKGAVSF